MGSLGRSFLVLCVAITIATLSAQQRERLSDQEAISLLLATYNRESNDDFIYGLLQAKSVSDQAEKRILSFTIQETKCLKSENLNPDQCEFKEGGLVRDCSGEISSEQRPPVVLVSCDLSAQEPQAQGVSDADPSPVHGRRGGRGRRGRGGRRGR
uniref:Cathelicidin antimicrobial peptide n=1 Tax=Vombatus ursinus TaxID=29139 RepID=A0A4X2KTY3_VOMUR